MRKILADFGDIKVYMRIFLNAELLLSILKMEEILMGFPGMGKIDLQEINEIFFFLL